MKKILHIMYETSSKEDYMIRKLSFYSIGIFIIYCLFMYWYFFFFANNTIPFEFQQTQADPAMFLDPKEFLLNEQFATIKNFLYFVATPLEWLIYFLLLITGLNKYLFKSGQEATKIHWLHVPIYVFWVTLITNLLMFPLTYFNYYLSKTYQVSIQSFPSWMKEELIDFWLVLLVTIVVVIVIYSILKKFKKMGWFLVWMLSVPVILVTMYIYPVVIDPLYNEFTPIQNKELETKILNLANQSGIPVKSVYQVNVSEKTNAINAYVTGIGNNARIVLWDSTLQKLTDEEILYIMAHEIAHYVNKDVTKSIAGYLLLSFFMFYLVSKLYNKVITNHGRLLKIDSPKDTKAYTLLILLLSILLFIASPMANAVSRQQERTADTFALELMKDPDAAISTYQKLARDNRSQINPPFLVKVFKSTHPSILERISKLEQYKIENRK